MVKFKARDGHIRIHHRRSWSDVPQRIVGSACGNQCNIFNVTDTRVSPHGKMRPSVIKPQPRSEVKSRHNKHSRYCISINESYVIMHAWMLQQEYLHAFCPYLTSFFHLALDFTKINFLVQIVPLTYHTLRSATE